MFGFLDPVVALASQALTWLLTLFAPLVPALAPALAILTATVLVRLLLHPLARAQVRGERSRAALAPHLRALHRTHAGDREKLAAATTALYREHGASPFAGCGPTLLQLPVFSVLYRLFTTPTLDGAPNLLLTHTVFGTPLGAHFLAMPADPVFWVLFAALAATATWSARFAARRMAAAPPTDAPGGALTARLVRVAPYITVVFALFVPLATVIYLVTTTTWTIAERAWLYRERPVKSLADKETQRS